MKNYLGMILIPLLVLSSALNAKTRDVAEIGMRAMLKGRISTQKPARDMTTIRENAEYAPNRLMVRFAPNADLTMPKRETKDAILSMLGGGTIEREYDLVPGLTLVRLPAGQIVNEDVLRRFNGSAEILSAEPDYKVHVQPCATPSDYYFGNQWSLDQASDCDIDASAAWNVTTGSSSIVVAVIDIGVDYTHPDLAGNMWTDGSGHYGYDADCDDYDPFPPTGGSYTSHGTHAAGIIGAVGNNGVGIAGVCWDVSLMAIRFCDAAYDAWESSFTDAFNYAAANGANVINVSWGFTTTNEYLQDAIAAMQEANILVVVAAGNNETNIDSSGFYPASYNLDNILTVMATDQTDYPWDSLWAGAGTNYGATSVDIAAPGESILSTVLYDQYGVDYAELDGTSFAAPLGAGACALLLSKNPLLDYATLKDIVLDSVNVLGSLDGKCVTEGRLNLQTAVSDARLNVNALTKDSSGDATICLDGPGNLRLTGTLTTGSCSGSGAGVKIRNSSNTLIAFLNAGTGNMCILGTCYESQGTLTPPSGSPWILKNSSGTVVAYMTSGGNLYLKGQVFETI